MDIELAAVSALESLLALCDGIKSHINEYDKEPIWDGNIYVYEKDAYKTENMLGRVPVQIKGKKIANSSTITCLTYQVKVSELNHYLNDGGVFYFVVAIFDQKKTIFYKALLPYELKCILKNIEKEKTKSITLAKMPNNIDSVKQLFRNFITDRKLQYPLITMTEEDIEKALRHNVVDYKIYFEPEKIIDSHSEYLKELSSQPFYIYAKTQNGTLIPCDYYDPSQKFIADKLNLPVYVNGKKYFDYCFERYEQGKRFISIGTVCKLPWPDKDINVKKSN
ncbi:MAG: hypothetical protein LBF22_15600, partial [Deltaproteobacteria bacterium]|nr:hypothetical protein [Deltaproteobacteria bacterium]